MLQVKTCPELKRREKTKMGFGERNGFSFGGFHPITKFVLPNKGWEEGVAGDWVFTNLNAVINVNTDDPKTGSYNLHIAAIWLDAAQWSQARYTAQTASELQALKGKSVTFLVNWKVNSADSVTRLSADSLYIKITDDVGTTQKELDGGNGKFYYNPDIWHSDSITRIISNTAVSIIFDIYYDKPLNAHRHHTDIDDMDAVVS